ncbi:hypothetical protein M211_2817 [Acinetobacter lactucae]|nr:hypothetical protein M211_2817 [Acinetobacter lactucae]
MQCVWHFGQVTIFWNSTKKMKSSVHKKILDYYYKLFYSF